MESFVITVGNMSFKVHEKRSNIFEIYSGLGSYIISKKGNDWIIGEVEMTSPEISIEAVGREIEKRINKENLIVTLFKAQEALVEAERLKYVYDKKSFNEKDSNEEQEIVRNISLRQRDFYVWSEQLQDIWIEGEKDRVHIQDETYIECKWFDEEDKFILRKYSDIRKLAP